jgi:hypothetical protein
MSLHPIHFARKEPKRDAKDAEKDQEEDEKH